MRSRIFKLNWEDFDYRNSEDRKNLAGAMQYFCALPNKFLPVLPNGKPHPFSKIEAFVKDHKQIQEFTLMSDGWVNEKAIDIIEKFHLLTNYDNGFEQIFDIRDYSGTKASGFDMAAVKSGLIFREVKEGEKLKVYQVRGAKERVSFCYYGGALGWHRRLFDDGDWWTLEDNAIEFRNKAYSRRAATYYGLLEAAADEKGCCATIPSDCDDCDSDARSIATSINYAATDILAKAADRGLSVDIAGTTFIVLTPLQLRGRVRYALGQRMQAFADSEKLIDYNFKQITSMMLTQTDRIMVILPGRTLKIGYRMDLTLFDDFDILSLTDTVAGWMRDGGCIGDIDQINCIELTEESGSCPPASFNPQVTCGEITGTAGVEDIVG